MGTQSTWGQYSKYLSFDHIKKKANQASKCPQSAKKRTLLFKKKWLKKQSLRRLRPLRRLRQRQQKKPKNNVFKNRKQQIKTSKILHATTFLTAKNLIHKRTIQWQNSSQKIYFQFYKYVQI